LAYMYSVRNHTSVFGLFYSGDGQGNYSKVCKH
jgi:hypothetical protein